MPAREALCYGSGMGCGEMERVKRGGVREEFF